MDSCGTDGAGRLAGGGAAGSPDALAFHVGGCRAAARFPDRRIQRDGGEGSGNRSGVGLPRAVQRGREQDEQHPGRRTDGYAAGRNAAGRDRKGSLRIGGDGLYGRGGDAGPSGDGYVEDASAGHGQLEPFRNAAGLPVRDVNDGALLQQDPAGRGRSLGAGDACGHRGSGGQVAGKDGGRAGCDGLRPRAQYPHAVQLAGADGQRSCESAQWNGRDGDGAGLYGQRGAGILPDGVESALCHGRAGGYGRIDGRFRRGAAGGDDGFHVQHRLGSGKGGGPV